VTDGWDQRLGLWWIAEDHPDLVAVAASPSGTTLTYGELAGRCHQIVHGLRRKGIVRDDIVAYALPNDVDILWWQFALQEGGMRAIALNPQLSAVETRAILEHSGAAALVCDAAFAAELADVDAPTLRLKVAVRGDINDFVPFSELIEGQPETLPEDRAFGWPIAYSSGTTGLPKAIGRTNPSGDPSSMADGMKLFGRAFGYRPLEGVHLASAGMHHGGCQTFYQGALNCGASVVVLGKFDPEATLRAISEHRVTTAYMVPTQFVRLLRLPDDVKQAHDVSSLEVVVHSAAPCPVEVKKQMMDWWGPVIWETYGGMEGAAAIAKPHHWLAHPGTVGRAIRGVTLKILDDDGNELGVGETGNVFLQPERPTFEYRGDPKLTASVHRGSAFTLGDMGFLDADGFLFLRDRAKDMIISGGVNIYPAEVEARLSEHPAVADVAVIGLPDAEWGESVKAIVQLELAFEPTEGLRRELIAHCKAGLAKFKIPRSVDFRDELPRTETGKLYKRLLVDEYRRDQPVTDER
jgi:long-chain acyl-CoA synthetase